MEDARALSVQIIESAKRNMYQNKKFSMGLLIQTDITILPRWLNSSVIRIHEMQLVSSSRELLLQSQIRFFYFTSCLYWVKSKFKLYPIYNPFLPKKKKGFVNLFLHLIENITFFINLKSMWWKNLKILQKLIGLGLL